MNCVKKLLVKVLVKNRRMNWKTAEMTLLYEFYGSIEQFFKMPSSIVKDDTKPFQQFFLHWLN